MEQQEIVSLAATKLIRERSEKAQLAQFEEILAELERQGLLESETAEQRSYLMAALEQAFKRNEDLREISDKDGMLHYYSTQSLSEIYARILVMRGKDPLLLIAQIIRENSAIYPRPVPLDIFRESPFDLAPEEILECLKNMREGKEYQDIAQATTSIGTIFLYSNRHLDADYASMLAEWFDVGQANNP
ncbi:MAG TPA: hypothetical protein VLW47_05130 [Thermodesulfobacteriota bacterium]|nr:hypothetical protein [Thermodesulfobacteriota bacterium]